MAFIFNYLGHGFDGLLHFENTFLFQYVNAPYSNKKFVYRITQTQGNSVA